MLRYTTDRARPGLVAFYDIWPGKGSGQFLQSRSLHGAPLVMKQYNLVPAKEWQCSIVWQHICHASQWLICG